MNISFWLIDYCDELVLDFLKAVIIENSFDGDTNKNVRMK